MVEARGTEPIAKLVVEALVLTQDDAGRASRERMPTSRAVAARVAGGRACAATGGGSRAVARVRAPRGCRTTIPRPPEVLRKRFASSYTRSKESLTNDYADALTHSCLHNHKLEGPPVDNECFRKPISVPRRDAQPGEIQHSGRYTPSHLLQDRAPDIAWVPQDERSNKSGEVIQHLRRASDRDSFGEVALR